MELASVCVFLTVIVIINGELRYNLLEEKPSGFYIGRISDSLDLPFTSRDNSVDSLRYSFLTHGYPHSRFFNLTHDGHLLTAKRLDREELCGFMEECVLEAVIVIQSTINQFFKKVKLTILLQDVNDHSPTFSKDSVKLEISEAVSVDSSFILESALDRDVGENSLQGYNLVSDSDNFALRATKNLDGGTIVSLVVVNPLDHERRNFYEIIIVAKDGASPPKTGTLSVNISVVDVNDNAPVFKPMTYDVAINETTPVNTIVTVVTATDRDSGSNDISVYRFSPLIPKQVLNYFGLNKTSGEIFVLKPLHDIQEEKIEFIVECIDGGTPPLVAQALVTIEVKDSTNNPPSINLNLFDNGEVSEDASQGTTVGHVAVRDPDSDQNGVVRCFVISDAFDIQGLGLNEYRIIVTEKLDREKHEQHKVLLTCKDAGKPQLNDTMTFSIKVRDENDNLPVFKQFDYLGNVSENVDPGQFILKVEAMDIDQGENSRISYYIPNSEKLGIKIDEHGQIISMKSFDREESHRLHFPVIASDHGQASHNASCTVTILILDVNDVIPTFKRPRYRFQVEENKPSGYTIGRIKASDQDDGANGEILYNIQLRFEELEYYPIKVTTDGVIQTVFPLDREMKSRYEFSVIASDRGTPSLSSSVEVVVVVTDQNDHAPSIMSPNTLNHSLSVPYHMYTNYALFTILAKDKDEGMNSRMEFSIQPEDGLGMFKIETESGVLRLSRFLTQVDIGNYELMVTVRDLGRPSLNSSVTFNISVYQTNETNAYLERVGSDGDDNLMIVLILGSVTGLIFVISILIIIIIRRSDRANQKFNANVITHMEPCNMKPDFTIMEFDDPTDVNLKNNSWDRTNNRCSYTDDLVSLTDVGAEQNFSKNRNRVSGEISEALKKHEALLKSYGVPTKVPIQLRNQMCSSQKHPDETGSHTSADTATNDSGRGGSDDETHHSKSINIGNTPEVNELQPRTRMSCDLSTFKQPLRPLPELVDISTASTSSIKPSTVLVNHYVPNLDMGTDINNKRVQFHVTNNTWFPTSTGSDPKLTRHGCHGNLSNVKNDMETCVSEVDSVNSDIQTEENGMLAIYNRQSGDVYV